MTFEKKNPIILSFQKMGLIYLAFLGILLIQVFPLWQKFELYPSFIFLLIFHWGLNRPDFISADKIFFLGIVHDSVFSLPLGLSSLVWIILYGLIHFLRPRLINLTFHKSWLIFAGFASLEFVLNWMGLLWVFSLPFPGIQAIPSYLFLILFYPLGVLISLFLQQIIDRYSH
jgi:cell shape-determining protein MreD